ncbi:MAG: Hpt domain-containing protein, partial [Spirochaetia bacterium]
LGYHSILNIEAAEEELSLDKDMIIALVKDFSSSKEQFLSPVRRGTEAGDFRMVRVNAHKLKGAAYNLRIDGIGESAEALEAAAAEEELDSCVSLLSTLEEKFSSLEKDISRL